MGETARRSSKKADRRRRVNRLPVLIDPADPTTLDRAVAYVWHDEAERTGFLLDAGVRWALLRHVPPAVRLTWHVAAAALPVPEDTRACWDGPEVWLDEVEKRVAGQQWQARKLRKWRRFAAEVAKSCARDRRPITGPGLTLRALAVVLGDPDQPISTRYVTTIIRWFRDEGLLGVVMPGTRTERLPAPEDETEAERKTREAAEQRAARARAAAHEARRNVLHQHAEAELAAAAAGLTPPPLPDELAVFRGALDEHPVDPDDESRLLCVAQVYELRVPDVRETPPEPTLPPGVADLSAARQKQAQRRRGAPTMGPVRPGLAAVAAARPLATQESSTPSLDLSLKDEKQIQASVVVDERAPSGRSEAHKLDPSRGSDQVKRSPVGALAAAERLLGAPDAPRGEAPRGVLPRQLTTGVRLAWLARRIAPFVAAGWTDEQLVAVIAYRGGVWTYVPPVVTNPGGWINAALGRWSPTAPPLVDDEVRAAVDHVEHVNDVARQEREARAPYVIGAARRAAIEACGLCDDQGYRGQDLTGPAIRCGHSPADADEVVAAAADQPPATERGRDEVFAILARRRGEGDVVDPVRAAVLDAARKSAADREAAAADRAADPTYVPRAVRKRWTR